MNCKINLTTLNIFRVTILTDKGLISIYEKDLPIIGNGVLKEVEFLDGTIQNYNKNVYFIKNPNNLYVISDL